MRQLPARHGTELGSADDRLGPGEIAAIQDHHFGSVTFVVTTTEGVAGVKRVASGDVNGDSTLSVADVFYLINSLFAGGPAPIGPADPNATGTVDVSDVFYLINYLFAGGPAPK